MIEEVPLQRCIAEKMPESIRCRVKRIAGLSNAGEGLP